MKYTAARFNITCEDNVREAAKDLLAALAGEAGFESFEDTPAGLDGYAQTELFDRSKLDEGIADFPIEKVGISYTLEEVPETNWNTTWEEEGFEPIDVDGRVLIFDARRPLPQEHEGYQVLIGIEARMAFGTGTHQTTRMVVSALTNLSLKDKRLLDCGCGTGILSIAALKLGAVEAVGYDIDEWAVENAKHNADINKVKGFSVFHGNASVLSHVSGVFDVVVANINRNILLADLPQFKDVMNIGATLVLSGFYEDDIPLLLEEAAKYGLQEKGRKVEDQWACLILALQ